MSEANLWKWLSGILPEGHYSRIESHDTSPGFPDVRFQLGTMGGTSDSGTFELKFSRTPKAEKHFKTEKDGLHKSQKAWIRDELRHGGRVWIIAEVSPQIFIIPGRWYESFNNSRVSDLKKMSEFYFTRRETHQLRKKFIKLMTGED